MALPEGFRRTFFKNVSFPLLLVLLLTLCAAAASLWLTSRQINANVVRREQETVRASVAQRLHELAVQQYSITVWPPLYAQLIRPTLDRQWLDENVGGWLYTVFHHQQVYLLNARRQEIYAAIEGLSVSPQAPVPLLAQAARLIDAASRLPANTPLAHCPLFHHWLSPAQSLPLLVPGKEMPYPRYFCYQRIDGATGV
ncbi:hypothetical protein SODG_002375 [Sodalis praecaptivus]|nr:hypothetical protein NVIRENTERO_00773 [Sodalis praecaptivus]